VLPAALDVGGGGVTASKKIPSLAEQSPRPRGGAKITYGRTPIDLPRGELFSTEGRKPMTDESVGATRPVLDAAVDDIAPERHFGEKPGVDLVPQKKAKREKKSNPRVESQPYPLPSPIRQLVTEPGREYD